MEIEKFNEFESNKKGYVGIKLDIPNWEELCKIIKPEDIVSLEDDPHVTVIYGIHSFVNANDVLTNLRLLKLPNIEFGKVGFFPGAESDVVIIELESPDLHDLHSILKTNLSNEQTHPTYNPHVTLGYVKKGTAEKYKGMQLEISGDLDTSNCSYCSASGTLKLNYELQNGK